MELMASVSSFRGADVARRESAAGIGLVRTELLFAGAGQEPDVAAQSAAYVRVAEGFAGRPVMLRTWDPAPDKTVRFLAPPRDAPNAGGWSWRGIRSYRGRFGVLDRQLEAFAHAGELSGAQMHVLAPMVAEVDEASWFTDRARRHGIGRAGVMVEVPALTLVMEQVCLAVDFVSIGLSDLAQFAFAASRDLPEMSRYLDPWQPALLRLVHEIVGTCAAAGTPVGVCGVDGRSDSLVAVLVGMGLTSIVLPAPRLGKVRHFLSRFPADQCQAAALAALGRGSAREARAAAETVLGAYGT